MKITLLLIGDTHKGFVYEGVTEYRKRLEHYVKFEILCFQISKKFKNLSRQEIQNKESELLETKIDNKSTVILLDEIGKEYTSKNFSVYLQKNMNTGKDIMFVVGGAYGFNNQLKNKYPKISLSKMTFSHQMIRLFFVEQLYRAFTIIRGENYHH